MKVKDLFYIITNYGNCPVFVFFDNIPAMLEAVDKNVSPKKYPTICINNGAPYVDPECIFSKEFFDIDVVELRAIGKDKYAVVTKIPLSGGDDE